MDYENYLSFAYEDNSIIVEDIPVDIPYTEPPKKSDILNDELASENIKLRQMILDLQNKLSNVDSSNFVNEKTKLQYKKIVSADKHKFATALANSKKYMMNYSSHDIRYLYKNLTYTSLEYNEQEYETMIKQLIENIIEFNINTYGKRYLNMFTYDVLDWDTSDIHSNMLNLEFTSDYGTNEFRDYSNTYMNGQTIPIMTIFYSPEKKDTVQTPLINGIIHKLDFSNRYSIKTIPINGTDLFIVLSSVVDQLVEFLKPYYASYDSSLSRYYHSKYFDKNITKLIFSYLLKK
jgi:hypothetical protein